MISLKKWIKAYRKVLVFAFLFSVFTVSLSSYFFGIPITFNSPGTVIDEFNGVEVRYNGSFSNVNGRNLSDSGYNIGLKWQCVEYVKRYYLEIYNHKMPNSYGNAIDFYDTALNDGDFNKERALFQFSNPSKTKPEIGEIMVLNGGYGHVAIISDVGADYLEVTQQNVGFNTREKFQIEFKDGLFAIENSRVLGRLRKID